MKADLIIKNAEIYTVDEKYPWAEALAVKDGKLIYVGTNTCVEDFEGPVVDAQGKFIMPGIIDSHVHIAMASEFYAEPSGVFIYGNSKTDILEKIQNDIAKAPEAEAYKFYINAIELKGEKITRWELDEICPDKPLLVVEAEQHSRWLNSLEMKRVCMDEFKPDIAPGLSYCERDNEGRIIGRVYEFCGLPSTYKTFDREVYKKGLDIILDSWKKWGVVAGFDAGMASSDASYQNFFGLLHDEDEKGNLPIYVEGVNFLYDKDQFPDAIRYLKSLDETHRTEHVRIRTMKIMMDGTTNGRTAALFDKYVDDSGNGGTVIDTDALEQFLLELNEAKVDLHVHSVGERAINLVFDAVERVRAKLGDEFTIQVTCAHCEILPRKYLGRFAATGVGANYTPHWSGGNCVGLIDDAAAILGKERAYQMYASNTVWNTGALVSFSSDDVTLDNMKTWNPYMGMEVGITRQDSSLSSTIDEDFSGYEPFPSNAEKMSMAQMIKGYTINGAKQMRLDDKIGSLEVGKDASFLIFEESLFDIDKYQIHKQLPKEVFIKGVLQK